MEYNALKIIILLFGSFMAALISGAAGFGGALLLLPILSWSIGPVQAVPVLTIAQLVGNLARVFVGFKKIIWKPVFIFLLSAIPFPWQERFHFQ